MSNYYTLSEKRKYIEDDFKENGPYCLGVLPNTLPDRIVYIKAVKQLTFSWLSKYMNNSQYGYALELASDFVGNIEKSVI